MPPARAVTRLSVITDIENQIYVYGTHLDTEILIIDEVLAVGDFEYQTKCNEKLIDLTNRGKTAILVSHNLGTIQKLCSKTILLKQGDIKGTGKTADIINQYLNDSSFNIDIQEIKNIKRIKGNTNIFITDFSVLNPINRQKLSQIISGQDIIFKINYSQKNTTLEIKEVAFGIQIYFNNGQFLTALNSLSNSKFYKIKKQGEVFCHLNKFPLMPGIYFISLLVIVNKEISDLLENIIKISVVGGDFYGNNFDNSYNRQGFFMDQKWYIEN